MGVGVSLALLWKAPYAFLLLWFALTLAIGGVLTDVPPFSPRLIGAFPAVALLVGIGLNAPYELVSRVEQVPRALSRVSRLLRLHGRLAGPLALVGRLGERAHSRRWRTGLTVLFALALLVIGSLAFRWNYHEYFHRYPSSGRVFWPWIEPNSALGRYLASQDGPLAVYIFRTPHVYKTHPAIGFPIYGKPVTLYDVECFRGPQAVPKPPDDAQVLYVFLPETRQWLASVQRAAGGGVVESVSGHFDPGGAIAEQFVVLKEPAARAPRTLCGGGV